MEVEVEGIVLKDTLYGESSKIIQVLTKEYGLVSIIAKGASSYKNSLRSLTLPFLYAKFKINYKKDKLSTLKGGNILNLYGSKANDIKVYAYISYICELAYKVLQENNDKDIFVITKNALDKVTSGFNYNVIKNIVEFKCLDYIGIRPDFSICHKCFNHNDFYALDGKIGGFICKNCYTNEKVVPKNFDKILNRYQNVDISEINEIKISKENEIIVNEFLKEYYETFSSIHLNSENLISILDLNSKLC